MKKRKTYDIQVIQNTITLTETSILDPAKWRFIELRSASIPVSWSDRAQVVKVFGLIAALHISLFPVCSAKKRYQQILSFRHWP
jgi:hypothetical protein